MINVAFVVLCHEPAAHLLQMLSLDYFSNRGTKLYIHYDAAAPQAEFDKLSEQVLSLNNAAILKNRVACKWGEVSLVEATLRGVEAALADKKFRADYIYLISGSCVPIKPFATLQRFLHVNSHRDFIEAVDPEVKQWTVGGYEMERLRRYYPFNFKTERWKFEAFTKLQKWLFIRRLPPDGMNVRFGSQWFCLRRKTAEAVCDYLRRPNIQRFLADSWIPDEFAIQSAAATAGTQSEIAGTTLTYYEFNRRGRPITLYDDHVEHLKAQPHFFARKRSPRAQKLLSAVADLSASTTETTVAHNETMQPSGHFKVHQKVFAGASLLGNRGKGELYNPLRANRRDYFVITGVSPVYIRAVLAKLRAWKQHCTYDNLFDKDDFIFAHELSHFNGYSAKDRARRNYRPLTFLLEILQNRENLVIFALDPQDMPYMIDQIRQDGHAQVLVLDPPVGSLPEKYIFRLSAGEAEALLPLSGPVLRDAIFARFDVGHTQFTAIWRDTTLKTKTASNIVDLADARGGIPDVLRAMQDQTPLEDLFSPAHMQLLEQLRR